MSPRCYLAGSPIPLPSIFSTPAPSTPAHSANPSKVPTPFLSQRPTFTPTYIPGMPTPEPTEQPSSMPSTRKLTKSPNSLPTSGPTGLPTLSPTFPPSYLPRSLTPAPTGRPTMSPTTSPMNSPIYRVGAPTPSPAARPSPSPTASTYLLGNPTSSQHKTIITPFHLPHTIAQLPSRQPHLVSMSVLSRCSSLESPLFVIREA